MKPRPTTITKSSASTARPNPYSMTVRIRSGRWASWPVGPVMGLWGIGEHSVVRGQRRPPIPRGADVDRRTANACSGSALPSAGRHERRPTGVLRDSGCPILRPDSVAGPTLRAAGWPRFRTRAATGAVNTMVTMDRSYTPAFAHLVSSWPTTVRACPEDGHRDANSEKMVRRRSTRRSWC